MKKYLVLGKHSWNHRHFVDFLEPSDGVWTYVSDRDTLKNYLTNSELEFEYVFFLHWSHKVPDEMLRRWQCVCFHMTDVPFGRGGTPLQNLIARGLRETRLSALRMTSDFDAGPVYLKRSLSLEGSCAEEIYTRVSALSCQMALEISRDCPEPVAQEGEIVVFHRRKFSQSKLPSNAESLQQLHDHIRMLDAEGYPHAFLDIGNFRIKFRRSTLYNGRVEANVEITQRKEE